MPEHEAAGLIGAEMQIRANPEDLQEIVPEHGCASLAALITAVEGDPGLHAALALISRLVGAVKIH